MYENGSKIALNSTCSKGCKWKKLTLVCACVSLKSLWQLSRSKVVLKPFWRFKLFRVFFPYGKQTWKSLNRQNGFKTTLQRLSCHNDFKLTQAQTKVSFFYLNPLLQVEFRAIFEPFSYILLNGSNVTQCCHVCKSQTTSGPPVISLAITWSCDFSCTAAQHLYARILKCP